MYKFAVVYKTDSPLIEILLFELLFKLQGYFIYLFIYKQML